MIWNTDLVETLEFENWLAQATVSINSALQSHRKLCRHMREMLSRPRRQSWLKQTLAWLDAAGCTHFEYRPVHLILPTR